MPDDQACSPKKSTGCPGLFVHTKLLIPNSISNIFELNIKNGTLPPGLAIDDGVAVLFIDEKPSEVYSSRKNHKAYFINTNKKISLEEYIK